MPYCNHNQKVSLQMITTFIVLGIVLLAIPAICALFVLFSKAKQRKRAEIIKNATTTTVRLGANGRTVFETTTFKSSSPQIRPRDPIIPFAVQRASITSRPKSVKSTWKRLSRPFSMGPAIYEDDQIELAQKQHPVAYQSTFHEKPSTIQNGIVSPIASPEIHRIGSKSSWNTIDRHGISPISPITIDNVQASSSFTAAVSQAPHTYQENRPQHYHRSQDVNQLHSNTFATIPLTHPAAAKKTFNVRAPTGPGSIRGIVATTVKEQILTDANKPKAKHAAKGVIEAAGKHAGDNIKNSVLDSRYKSNRVQLSAPPNAKLSKKAF